MIYASIVGTQVMAIVNPLLSICQKSPLKIDCIRLMPTPQTIGHGEQALKAIKLALPDIKDVNAIPISNDAGTDKKGNPPGSGSPIEPPERRGEVHLQSRRRHEFSGGVMRLETG